MIFIGKILTHKRNKRIRDNILANREENTITITIITINTTIKATTKTTKITTKILISQGFRIHL